MARTRDVIIIILTVLIVGGTFLAGMITGKYTNGSTEEEEVFERVIIEGERIRNAKFVAVDNFGQGVSGDLTTEIKPGKGLVLVNINDVLADVNLQYSARLAKQVAKNVTKKDLNFFETIYDLEIYSGCLNGQSAGSTMATSLIAAILDKELREDVVLTGSILADGTVDKAGSIKQKAEAAKEMNATLFLIPTGAIEESNEYKREKKCGAYENTVYCRIDTIEEHIDINEDFPIQVIEVSRIEEVMEALFIDNEIQT